MTSKYKNRNAEILQAKGTIPFWVIADQLGVHENTVRNWLKREMDPEKKGKMLEAIEEIKQELTSIK